MVYFINPHQPSRDGRGLFRVIFIEHIQWSDDGTGVLKIRVTTKASVNRIRIEKRKDEKPIIRMDVTVAPEDGKANKQVIKELRMPKSALTIKHGFTNRDKIIAFLKT